MNFITDLATQLIHAGARIRVKTPKACDSCLYREKEWRDGGWCYMFRKMPSPTCAQFKPSDSPPPSQSSGRGER